MLFILDRDGVINADPDGYINNPDHWHALDGSIEAIARLHQTGHKVAVCTNQSGIGRGYITPSQLGAVHDKMATLIRQAGGELCGIYICPHHPDEQCLCRKPHPTLYHEIIKMHNTADNIVWAIGDSVRDIEAGISSQCATALVLTGNGTQQQPLLSKYPQTMAYPNLAHAVDHILGT